MPRSGVEPARLSGQRIIKSGEWAITESYETIQASIIAPSVRQGIAWSGLVSTRTVTILVAALLDYPDKQMNGLGARANYGED